MKTTHERTVPWALALLCSLCAGLACAASDDGDDDGATAPSTSEADSTTTAAAVTTAEAEQDESSGEPEPIADGEICTDSEECAGECYVLPMLGGTCGECSSDADCPNGGCSAPGFNGDPAQPQCNDGSLSSTCEADDACQDPLVCVDALDFGAFILRGCSTCSVTEDCAAGEQCNMEIELGAFSGYKQCVAEQSVEVGRTCSVDISCTTGICAEADLMGAKVGVCSDCREDSDCEAGLTCTGVVLDMASLSILPGRCE